MFSLFIFSSFFQGGQLTPFAPMCGRPCTWPIRWVDICDGGGDAACVYHYRSNLFTGVDGAVAPRLLHDKIDKAELSRDRQ